MHLHLYPNNQKRPLTQDTDIYSPQIGRPFYMQGLLGFILHKGCTKQVATQNAFFFFFFLHFITVEL